MAYITASQTRAIKKDLQETFPDFKFSVRNSNFSSISVTILSGPVRFDLTPDALSRRVFYDDTSRKANQGPQDCVDINEFHLGNYENSDLLKAMAEIINYGNHDNSDIQTDYFDVGWYVRMSAGTYDKPYICTMESNNAK